MCVLVCGVIILVIIVIVIGVCLRKHGYPIWLWRKVGDNRRMYVQKTPRNSDRLDHQQRNSVSIAMEMINQKPQSAVYSAQRHSHVNMLTTTTTTEI